MNFLISFILRLLSSIGNLSASQLVAVMLALTLNTRLILGTVELSTDLKRIFCLHNMHNEASYKPFHDLLLLHMYNLIPSVNISEVY